MSSITKDQFAAVLTEAGIADPQKQRLHAVFEQRHPEGHQAFLAWLGLPAEEIRRIRERSRS